MANNNECYICLEDIIFIKFQGLQKKDHSNTHYIVESGG